MRHALTINKKTYNLDTPKVMGILNLTPDSFFTESRCFVGGQTDIVDESIRKVERMIEEGMDILDIGAVSTRPGAKLPDIQEEWNRLKLPLKNISSHFPDLVISIDTFRADIAKECVNQGAHIINDISGGTFDENMLSTIAELQVPYILMHTLNKPETMQNNPQYKDVTSDIISFFSEKIANAHRLGINDLIIDPGFGFGKTIEHNYQLLAQMDIFKILNCPILVGMSRKSMLWKPLKSDPEHMLNATTVVNTLALTKGAAILRVHDVKQAVENVKLFNLYNIH